MGRRPDKRNKGEPKFAFAGNTPMILTDRTGTTGASWARWARREACHLTLRVVGAEGLEPPTYAL